MLIKLFEEKVHQFKDRIAVKSGSHWLTYGELDRYASLIAAVIEKRCAGSEPGKNQTVGLLLPHGVYMIAAILGTLKAGMVYVPLSSDYPENRLTYMLTDSETTLILTVSRNRALVTALGTEKEIPFIEIDQIDRDISHGDRKRQVKKDQLAYIMYTSGSTGRPKGVMQTHDNAAYYVRNWIQRFSLSDSDRMTLFSSFCHDGSVQDMFGALHSGAVLFPYDVRKREQEIDLSTFLEMERITIWHSVPSLFSFFSSTLTGHEKFPYLRFILLGGEPVREHEVNMLKKFFPGTILANVYGQTESSVNSIQCISPSDDTGRMLIGEPLDETEVFVVDDKGRPVRPLETGEIVVACRHISPGYWKHSETAEVPFSEDEKFGKLYWTGDLGCLQPDGNIEFIGRRDFQVKIGGFRVELGEVETILLKHENIKSAVVGVITGEKGENRLCAYFVPHALTAESGEKQVLTVPSLREYLSKELPEYMIPSYFLQLEQMPLTPNGKVDRKALPEPEPVRPELGVTYVAAQTDIEQKITGIWQEVLHLDKIGINDNFFDLGGNSFGILTVINKLQRLYKKDIPVVSMLRYPTIASFSVYLGEEVIGIKDTGGKESLETEDIKKNPRNPFIPVAVIGMAGRFPGARNTDELWESLKNGLETVTFFTNEQLKAEGIPERILKNPNYVKARGIIDDVEYFDSGFFNYSPAEAELMDPQLRLLLECAWEALENAGYDAETYDGSTGFYVGNAYNHYWVNLTRFHSKEKFDILFVNQNFSTKISYKLDLHGPSTSVQTACSTSLVTIHMACMALQEYECDMALAGGVSIMLPYKTGYLYQPEMILSPDGHCRAFDASAQGTVAGDGCGIVVLKRLDDAISAGDRIDAVIKGTAINNDGRRKIGILAPSVEGQAEVIRSAQQWAGIQPENIDFIEAHGTGTLLGDPVEIDALKLAFNTDKKGYCAIGSIKTNIGHLNTAAGIAGFIKAVLTLKHRFFPKSLHFKKPNPKIDFDNSPFYVNTKARELKKENGPLTAGVSSFGVGGTNAHVVLEEWTGTSASVSSDISPSLTDQPRDYQLVLLSAKTQTALDKMTENLAAHLKKNSDINLADAAYTLQVGRHAFPCRGMSVCRENDEFPLSSGFQTGLAREGQIPVVFMFSGQGSQYVNMGLELYRTEPVFQKEMDRCFEILNSLLDYDIKKILYPSLTPDGSENPDKSDMSDVSDINRTEIAQPLLFAFEYALAKCLMHWGIKPFAMTGHSIGEYTAAHLAGVFSLEEALKLVVLRGKLMQSMPSGSMLSTSVPAEELTGLLKEYNNPGHMLTVAAINTGSSCVVSGPTEAINSFANHLKEKGHESRLLHTSHAFHSAMMDPILKKFEQGVKEITLKEPQMPYISNITGTWQKAEDALNPEYWSKHLRETVRFGDGLGELLKQENAVFVEIGPGRALSTFVQQHEAVNPEQISVNLVRHTKEKISDSYYLLDKIGCLWLEGIKIDWKKFHEGEKRHRIPLPGYHFEKQHYWLEGDPYRMSSRDNKPRKKYSIGKKTDITEWFYIPSWQPTQPLELPAQETDKSGEKLNWLLFSHETGDGNGIGSQLLDRLQQAGHNPAIVYAGETYTNRDNGTDDPYDVYTIHPAKEEDYDALMAERCSKGKVPHRILHLWDVTSPDNSTADLREIQELGFYSLLFLARSLGRQDVDDEIRVMVVTGQMQGVTGDDLLYPQKTTVIGAIQVINREYPNIRCRSIDIMVPGSEPDAGGERELIDHLLAEVQADTPDTDTFTAFRNQHRWVKTFAAKPWFKPGNEIPRLKEGGIYLVTGGLGGIGLVLSQYLAGTMNPGLILTGRRTFPPREKWDDNGHDMETIEKIQKIREMEQNGARVLVFSADVTQQEQMAGVIQQAEGELGKIDGVIHAAGLPDGAMIQRRSREISEQVMGPKVNGTLVLDSLLADRKLDFFILCSSIASMTAQAGQAAYCAANAFLDNFAYYKHQTGNTFVTSINWDAWQEVGMAVDMIKELTGMRKPVSAPADPQSPGLSSSHPLFETVEPHGQGRDVFISRLSGSQHWVMAEHKVRGYPTLPGTAYLEIVNAALETYAGDKTIQLEDIYFLTPLVIGENETKEIRTIIRKQEGNGKGNEDGDRANAASQDTHRYVFSIISQRKPGKDYWVEHTRGNARILEKQESRQYDIQEILDTCKEKELTCDIEKEGAGYEIQRRTMDLGPRWNNLRSAWFGKDRGFGILELPAAFTDDINSYKFHPALMDVATTLLRRVSGDETPYVPFSYKGLRIMQNLPARISCHIWSLDNDTSKPGSGNNENPDNPKNTLKFAVRIMNEQGEELAEIEELTLKRLSLEGNKPAGTTTGKEELENFFIGISSAGTFNNLEFHPTPRRQAGPGEVEIKVHAAGLNFKEVLRTLGAVGATKTPIKFGMECSGKIVACGKGVKRFIEGDEVMALGAACFSQYVTLPAALVVKKPDYISLEEAATIPIAFMTAYHSLIKLARLGKGERVLIHSAAGGVGLAAVKIAQWAGAEIFATAGNEQKRKYLRSLGIQHVMNSRTPEFATEIKKVTGEKGLDVVLNSLAGESMLKSFSLLAPFGRFLEIGIRDMIEDTKIGLRPFLNGLSYYAVNLSIELPGVGDTWQEVVGHFNSGDFTPLPYSVFHIRQVIRAFEYMTAGTHMGKILLTLREEKHHPFSYFLSGTPGDAEPVKTAAIPGKGYQGQAASDSLKNAILPGEGIEVFRRVLSGEKSPQVMVSTVDLATRLKKVRFISGKSKQQRLPGMGPGLPGQSRSGRAPAYAAPGSDSEKKLVTIFQNILGIEKMGIHEDFFASGGDSLKAISLIGRINQAFNVQVTLDEVFASPTVHLLASRISGAEQTTFINIEKVEEKEYYPVSHHQKRIWYLNQLAPETAAYNIAFPLQLNHEVDEKALKTALTRLIARHESLRTGFKTVKTELVQYILKETDVDTPFETYDVSALEETRQKEEREGIYKEVAFTPFNLWKTPLFRVVLVKKNTDAYELNVCIHHLNFDGKCQQIFKLELFAIYEAIRTGNQDQFTLVKMGTRYRDFAEWQHHQLNKPAEEEKSYLFWKSKMQSPFPTLELPVDNKQSKDNPKGAGYMVWLDKEIKKSLDQLIKTNQTTLFMAMFSVFILFLYRFTQQQEVACSIITAGRDHLDLQNIIGIFSNSLPFKTQLDLDKGFTPFLKEINREVLEIFQNQNYPFERVCDDMKIRPPQIEVAFNMLNVLDELKMRELDSFEPQHLADVPNVRIDYEFYIIENKNGITLFCFYRDGLFRPSTVEYMMGEYIKLIDFFTHHATKSYKDYLQSERKFTLKK